MLGNSGSPASAIYRIICESKSPVTFDEIFDILKKHVPEDWLRRHPLDAFTMSIKGALGALVSNNYIIKREYAYVKRGILIKLRKKNRQKR